MDSQSYDIQWIHHAVGDMKDTRQLSISDHPPEDEHDLINEQSGNGLDGQHSHQDYLVHEVPTEEDIDQIAAENLIFMAHDGQMVAEIINTSSCANNDVAEPRKETSIDCNLLETSSAGDCVNNMEEQEIADGSHLVEFNEEYAETQMVTEEVITDDWVQPQGEERVEIPVDQIICSSSFQPMDNEVPLPTVQDEYTALRPYPCDFCSRRFRKKTSLMNHIVAHQNDRPHLCKLCGSRFFRRSDLINHLKAHAEMPDPEFDDVEFMNFVEQTRGNQQQQQHHSIDHYYDQGRNNRSHCTSKTVRQNRKSNAGTRSGYSSSSSHTSRVRARLINPKEENNYTIDETLNQKRDSNDAAHGTQFDFMERHEDEATTAAVKITYRNNQGQRAAKPNKFPVTDEKKPFVCQECGLAFAREKALMAHIKSHRTDSPYECKQCNEMFWDTSSLQDHLKTHQFEDSNSEYEPAEADETQTDSESEYLYGEFYCSSCGMAFHRQDLLKRHVKMHVKNEDDDIGGHCCNTCGETFVEALDLLAHAEIHARYPPFKCVLCGECFFEEATIKRHLHSMHAHEMTPNSCILCGKECRDRKALMKHAWDHSREKCHSCSKCGKNFHNKARLKRHMASHRDKSVNCDVCHEEFSDGRSLSNHRHSHSVTSSGKLFPCTECGKTFGSRSSQQIHVRIHTGERPYGCRYCWKAFADGGTLRKHERIHTGEKPYACAVCPRAFNQRVVLREHIRTHHSRLDIKRGTYYCSVCSAEMDSSNNLIQHLIQHSDTNTAMHRQPATGPRKYKRRRKLKPHELAHLRSEHKANGKVDISGSDIDISDLDMDNVEDFLGITESTSIGSNSARGKQSQKGPLVAEYVSAGNSSFLEQNHDSSSVQQTDTTSYGKERCNSVISNSCSKLNSWQSRLMNTNSKDETYKSLLSNLENTLQSIDTLVVGSKGNVDNAPKSPEVTYVSDRHLLSPVRTEPYSSRPGQQAASTAARVRSNKKGPNCKYTKSTRPRMIHTERSVSRTSAESAAAKRQPRTPKRSGTKMVQPAKQNSNDSSLTIDYDIILPGMQRQDNSTYSPVASIKHEYNNHQEGNIINTRHQQDTDIYDADLVLEATALRKDVYEKYNPNIVNDLEEMLRSPDKSSDKSRHRFASESSTGNYLVEQSEEELNIIKIEPTSPNIHDIVVGGSNSTEQQISQRSTRRQVALSRKYLDFETESSKRSRAPKACRHQNANKLPASSSANSSKSFMGYVSQESDNAKSVPSVDVGGSTSAVFTSISSVEAAGLSNNVAQVANAKDPASSSHSAGERKQRYYECEMCSAVFSDRAQLLDHVPIHI